MTSKVKLIAVMIAAGCLSACGGGSSKDQINQLPGSGQSAPAIDEAYQGIWASSAYGDVLVVDDNSALYYRYTSDYCILQDSFDELSTAELTRSVALNNSEDALEWFAGSGTREFHAPTRQLDKVSQLPASCASDPLTVESDMSHQELFALYSQIMAEYYVDFARMNVDWPALSYAQETQITEQDTTLYEAVYQTLLPLADSHNSWVAADGTIIRAYTKPVHTTNLIEEYALANGLSYPLQDSELNNAIVADIESYIDNALGQEINIIMSYATSDIGQDASEQIAWFAINNIGYLRIDAMHNYSTADEDSDDLAQTTSNLNNLNQALDEALTDLAATDGLIIDVRYNGGGNDYISLAIASRFTESEFLAYKKYARDGAGVTATQTAYIAPSQYVNYTGKPVALLVSNDTASAAETFSLSMQQLPHVTLVGEATHGIFSDIMQWVLPGEHELGISNEVYLSPDDEWYEGVGVPVDVNVPFFSLSDRTQGVDSAIDAALEVLQ